jgi:hypothetical protein
MKYYPQILLLLFLCSAPFLAVKPVRNYYKYYEEIAKKYECYPVDDCKSDFDGDGKPDVFTDTERLIILAGSQQILNIKYDHTDGTFRTHVAVFEEKDVKKLVVYDTINTEQFFYWDGNKLSPTKERTQLEFEIWKAMSLNDDTGGFNEKINLDLIFMFIFGLYYFVLIGSVCMYIYFKRKLKLELS